MASLMLDATALLLVGVNVYLGCRFGVVGRALSFAGLFAAVGLASFVAPALARVLIGRGSPSNLYGTAITYLIVLLLIMVVIEVLSFLYTRRLRTVTSSFAFERTLSAAAGIAIGIVEVALGVMVASAVGNASSPFDNLPPDRSNALKVVHDAPLLSHVPSIEPGVQAIFAPVLPRDLSNALAANDTTT